LTNDLIGVFCHLSNGGWRHRDTKPREDNPISRASRKSHAELPKAYLGDGAYVEFSGYDFRVYTSDGISETNNVHLEPPALQALLDFARKQGIKLRTA
jgi:hypothetical protein